MYSANLAPNDFYLFPHMKKKTLPTIFDARWNGWCILTASVEGTGVEKLLRKLVETHANFEQIFFFVSFLGQKYK